MESFYSVTHNAEPCGKVSVRKQGLYYLFHCRCMVGRRDIYRLILSCGNFQQSLGVLAPVNGSFELTTRVSARQLPEGDWSFRIRSGENRPAESFVPIRPDEPFAYIARLKDSFLEHQNGEPGILVEKTQE